MQIPYILIIWSILGVLFIVALYETINLWRKFPQTLWKTPVSRFIFLFPSFEREWNTPHEHVVYIVQNRYIQSVYFLISTLFRLPSMIIFYRNWRELIQITTQEDDNNVNNENILKIGLIATLISSYLSTITIFLVLHNMSSLLTSVWFKKLVMHYMLNVMVVIIGITIALFCYYIDKNFKSIILHVNDDASMIYRIVMLVCTVYKVLITVVIGWRLSRKLLLSPTYTSKMEKYCTIFRFWFFILGLVGTEFFKEFTIFDRCTGTPESDLCIFVNYTSDQFIPFFLFNFIFMRRIKGNDKQLALDQESDGNLDQLSTRETRGSRTSFFYLNEMDDIENEERNSEFSTANSKSYTYNSFLSSFNSSERKTKLSNFGVEMEEIIQSYEVDKKRKIVEDTGRLKGQHILSEKNEF